jgi:hypothetical protein
LLLVASVHLRRANSCRPFGPSFETSGCDPTATPVACHAIACTNQTLFTPSNSDLPEGTYIAASLTGVLQLAEHLESYPNVTVTDLLLSDSTIEDLATDFGYGDDFFDLYHAQKLVDYAPLNSNISQSLRQTILELDVALGRIMDRVAPSLESFSYVNYIRIWGEHGRVDVPDSRTRTVLDREFPRLTHLTLRDQQWRFQNLAGEQTFFRALPSLSHLHILSNKFPPLSTIRQSVPNATHIRLSGNLPGEFVAAPMFLVRWVRSLIRALGGRYVRSVVLSSQT